MNRHCWNLAAAEEHLRDYDEFVSPSSALARALAEPLERARSARLRLSAATRPLREGDRVEIGYGKSGTVMSGRVGRPDSTGLHQYWVKPDQDLYAQLVWVREDSYHPYSTGWQRGVGRKRYSTGWQRDV